MHLSSEIALNLIEGRLSQAHESFWREHLGVCTECAEDISRWQQFEADLKPSHLKSAPDETLKKVTQSFPLRREPEEFGRPPVIATLTFDSFRDLALFGARGASAARQLVMRAEEFDIHIKIWGEPDHRQMLGQLLPRSGARFVASARFHLMQNGERLETAGVDETGEFHFTDVPEGNLSLQIDLPNLTVIGALNIREINNGG